MKKRNQMRVKEKLAAPTDSIFATTRYQISKEFVYNKKFSSIQMYSKKITKHRRVQETAAAPTHFNSDRAGTCRQAILGRYPDRLIPRNKFFFFLGQKSSKTKRIFLKNCEIL